MIIRIFYQLQIELGWTVIHSQVIEAHLLFSFFFASQTNTPMHDSYHGELRNMQTITKL